MMTHPRPNHHRVLKVARWHAILSACAKFGGGRAFVGAIIKKGVTAGEGERCNCRRGWRACRAEKGGAGAAFLARAG
eukprot:306160-Chlamydomonas_euryale.AAC.1